MSGVLRTISAARSQLQLLCSSQHPLLVSQHASLNVPMSVMTPVYHHGRMLSVASDYVGPDLDLYVKSGRVRKPGRGNHRKDPSISGPLKLSNLRLELQKVLAQDFLVHHQWLDVCNALDCEFDEFSERIESSCKRLKNFDPQKIKAKVDFLMSEGYRPRDILDTAWCLCHSLDTLRSKCERMKEAGIKYRDYSHQVLKIIARNKVSFEHFLFKVSECPSYLEEKWGPSISLADALLVDQFTVEFFFPSYILDGFLESRLVRTVTYLLSVGVSSEEILDTPYVLFWSIGKLEHAHRQLQVLGVETPTLKQLHNYVKKRKVVAVSSMAFDNGFVSSPLKQAGIPVEVLRKLKSSDLQQITGKSKVPQRVMRENWELLRRAGFSAASIQDIGLVLVHDTPNLQDHLATLRDRRELDAFRQRWRKDDARLLNALQYLMERDACAARS